MVKEISENLYNEEILLKANSWLSESYDNRTRRETERLLQEDPAEIREAFYTDLEFGTGGLRGIMGVGTNRMNQYTVGFATQGLANWLKCRYIGKDIKVAVSYDSRRNSRYFADITVDVFSANGIFCYCFEDIRPTPELSFAVRQLGCQAGVMITASHNPKEYNGYKVYGEDGAQLVFPDDEEVIRKVRQIKTVDDVLWTRNPNITQYIGEEVDEIYLKKILSLSIHPMMIKNNADLKIVYTPLHGTGNIVIPKALQQFGFNKIYMVEAQMIPDGNFPTVLSPNPEESSALELALQKATVEHADLVLATDPDADRVGIAFRNSDKEYQLLNGNTIATLLIYYLLSQRAAQQLALSNDYIVKTIVTTELISAMADHYKIACYDVLTGFKYIAELIRKKENIAHFVAGGEESYGYLIGDSVRDKDAVSACCMIAEMTLFFKLQNKTLQDALIDIYCRFGFYKQKTVSLTKKGIDGVKQIQEMMLQFRQTPNHSIAGIKITKSIDYAETDKKDTELPKSDALQYLLEDGSKITIRPSGTEPKIKFYFEVRAQLNDKECFKQINDLTDKKIHTLMTHYNLIEK